MNQQPVKVVFDTKDRYTLVLFKDSYDHPYLYGGVYVPQPGSITRNKDDEEAPNIQMQCYKRLKDSMEEAITSTGWTIADTQCCIAGDLNTKH